MRAPVAVLLCAVLALGGCAVPQDPGAPGSPQSTPTPTKADQARRLAASYDYEAALAVLAGDESEAATAAAAEIEAAKAAAVAWPDNTQVSHIFYHSLIVDPARAFDPKTPQRAGYAQYMVTQHEFAAQLEQIHANGWVLIHPQRLAALDPGGTMQATPIYLPQGKKPLVLSIDDVSYYKYMDGDGFATDLTLVDGKVRNTYTDAAGNTQIGAFDVSTVVDDFVAEHPDFSYRGDKGTFALTGYEGVFGYRSSTRVFGDTDTTRQAIASAKEVAAALTETGWRFASHSYGHIDMTKKSLAAIQSDTQRWKEEVEPIVGPTDALIFAYGADIQNAKPYSTANAKYAYLLSQGFRFYFPIDSGTPAWGQLTSSSLRQARINIDGITMQRALDGKQKVLPLFFDTASVLDPARPIPTP